MAAGICTSRSTYAYRPSSPSKPRSCCASWTPSSAANRLLKPEHAKRDAPVVRASLGERKPPSRRDRRDTQSGKDTKEILGCAVFGARAHRSRLAADILRCDAPLFTSKSPSATSATLRLKSPPQRDAEGFDGSRRGA